MADAVPEYRFRVLMEIVDGSPRHHVVVQHVDDPEWMKSIGTFWSVDRAQNYATDEDNRYRTKIGAPLREPAPIREPGLDPDPDDQDPADREPDQDDEDEPLQVAEPTSDLVEAQRHVVLDGPDAHWDDEPVVPVPEPGLAGSGFTFSAGEESGRSGAPISDNPHPFMSDQSGLWASGWHKGAAEFLAATQRDKQRNDEQGQAEPVDPGKGAIPNERNCKGCGTHLVGIVPPYRRLSVYCSPFCPGRRPGFPPMMAGREAEIVAAFNEKPFPGWIALARQFNCSDATIRNAAKALELEIPIPFPRAAPRMSIEQAKQQLRRDMSLDQSLKPAAPAVTAPSRPVLVRKPIEAEPIQETVPYRAPAPEWFPNDDSTLRIMWRGGDGVAGIAKMMRRDEDDVERRVKALKLDREPSGKVKRRCQACPKIYDADRHPGLLCPDCSVKLRFAPGLGRGGASGSSSSLS